MRIARPQEPSAEFRRKRGPPPQATRLLTVSMASGAIFIVLLAVVFIPRGLQYGSPPLVAILDLRFNTSAGPRLDVVSATYILEVGKFRAEFYRNGSLVATLPPGLGGGNSTLSFVDTNGDAHLGPGDTFPIVVSVSACHRFEVFQVDADARVGFREWGACSSR